MDILCFSLIILLLREGFSIRFLFLLRPCKYPSKDAYYSGLVACIHAIPFVSIRPSCSWQKKKKKEFKDADCHSIHYVMNGIFYQLEMLVRYSLIRKALTIAKGVNGCTWAYCLIVQPPLFDHHRRVGYLSFLSDIANHGQGVVEKLSTDGIRWST